MRYQRNDSMNGNYDDSEQEFDDVVEINDLPEGQALPLRKHSLIQLTLFFSPLLIWTRHHRRVSVLSTVSLVVIALMIFVSSILPLQQLEEGKGLGPTPTPKFLSGPNLFYFNPLPSWGTVTLDGQPLAHVPVPIVRDEPPIRLPQGRHVLEWHAAPFAVYRCALFVPIRPSAGQMCNVTHAPSTALADTASLVTIPVSLAQLPHRERAALIQEMQSLLDILSSDETVQPGEHYTTTEHSGQIQTATVPLRATLRLSLDTDTRIPVTCTGVSLGQGCTIGGRDCRLFCTPLWPKTSGAAWDVAVLFHTTWHYTTLDGMPIASAPSVASSPLHDEQFVMLHVMWTQSQWQVSFQNRELSSFDDPLCIATIGQVQTHSAYQQTPGTTTQLTWAFTSSRSGAAGCLAASHVPDTQGSPSPKTHDALLLHRFGVLLAVNGVAHHLWPSLPVADSQEQHLAQTLLSQTIW